MSNNEKKYYIYFNHNHSTQEVSEAEFREFYKYSSNYRRTQQRKGLCSCPRGKWYRCDTDCDYCPYRGFRDELSLDYNVTDESGNSTSFGDILEDPTRVDDLLAEKEEMVALFRRLSKIMPEAITIGQLRFSGMPDTDIAKEIGIANTTFLSRLKKAKSILEKEFSEFF